MSEQIINLNGPTLVLPSTAAFVGIRHSRAEPNFKQGDHAIVQRAIDYSGDGFYYLDYAGNPELFYCMAEGHRIKIIRRKPNYSGVLDDQKFRNHLLGKIQWLVRSI